MYNDRWISCDSDGIQVRGYYFPWGAKRIAYASVRSVARVPIGLTSGRARIWGTANPRFWLNLDPARPRKETGFIFDLGRRVRPILTPDDPHAFEAEISSRVRVDSGKGAGFV